MSPKFSLIIQRTPKMSQLNNSNNKAEAAVVRKCLKKNLNSYTVLLHGAKKNIYGGTNPL